jgi:hypothetical protein
MNVLSATKLTVHLNKIEGFRFENLCKGTKKDDNGFLIMEIQCGEGSNKIREQNR